MKALPVKLSDLVGKKIKAARLGYEHASEDGPEPALLLEFTDGSSADIRFRSQLPLGQYTFFKSDKDDDRKTKEGTLQEVV